MALRPPASLDEVRAALRNLDQRLMVLSRVPAGATALEELIERPDGVPGPGSVRGQLLVKDKHDAWVAIPAGTDGQVITADSSQLAGLSWAKTGDTHPVVDITELVKGSVDDTKIAKIECDTNIPNGTSVAVAWPSAALDLEKAVTAAAAIADNALVRGAGGSRGVQDCGVLVNDSDEMSGLTKLDVDNLRFDGNTISSLDANGDINLTPNGTGVVRAATVIGSAAWFTTGIQTPLLQNPLGDIDIDAYSGAADTVVSVLNSDAGYEASLDVEKNITLGGTLTATMTGPAKANLDILTLVNEYNNADMDGTATSILFRQAYLTGTLDDAVRIKAETDTDWTSTASTRDASFVVEIADEGVMTEALRVKKDAVDRYTLSAIHQIQVEVENTSNNRFRVFSNTANKRVQFNCQHAGGTIASPSVCPASADLGGFYFGGYDGASWIAPGRFEGFIDGAISSGVMPTAFRFKTGTSSPVIRLTIASDGLCTFASSVLLGATSEVGINTELRFGGSPHWIKGQLDGLHIHVDAGDALFLESDDIRIPTDDGINYNPGSDKDVNIFTVGVTDAPRGWWDESLDSFAFTKGLQLAGPLRLAVTTITGATTLTDAHGTVLMNLAGGAFTATLPGSPALGTSYRLKKIDVSANAGTVDGNGANIDGSPTKVLAAQYDSIDVTWGGTEWGIH